MARLRVTILGCGSSGGVPRLGGLWGACDPDEPRNRRRRCSILVERIVGDRTTRVLVDTSPDLRAQLLDAGVGFLDGVVYTHAHADHVHGIDDLRMVVFNRGSRLPVWADPDTANALIARFGYAFVQPMGSDYPAILDLHTVSGAFEVPGAAGPIRFLPIPVQHGNIESLALRIHDIAYLPDVSDIPAEAWPHFEGLDIWILDALRHTPHPSHAHLALSLEWIRRAAPKRAILTNMHIDLDYKTLSREAPDHVAPAYDGLAVEVDI